MAESLSHIVSTDVCSHMEIMGRLRNKLMSGKVRVNHGDGAA